MEPNTGKSVMTKEEARQIINEGFDKLAKALERPGGAQVNFGVTDPTWDKVKTWVWSAMGAAALGLGYWGINSINNLNITIAKVSEQYQGLDTRVKLLEAKK